MTLIGPISPFEPGGELNVKAKRRWESLRRREGYRRDWDEAFARMVKILKEVFIISPEDYGEYFGFETDIHKIIKDLEIRTVDGILKEQEKINEKIEERRAELNKDPKKLEEFRKKKFAKDWPPGKLKEEFIYSKYQREGRELANKYGLSVPYHYDDPLWDPYKRRMKHVFKDMWPLRIIPQNPTSYDKLSPDRKTVIADYTPNLREGRYLTIEIDIYEKLGTLKKLIDSQLEFYQNILKLPKAKKRDKSLDFYIETEKGKYSIYDLWDMKTKDGKSPWGITKELYPSKTEEKHYQSHSNKYDKTVRAKWKQIDSGIKIADKEINSPL